MKLGPDRHGQDQREQDHRERHRGVGDPHQDGVDAAAVVAGHEADGGAHDALARSTVTHAGGQRHARAVHDAGEHVAPEPVGAERMRPAAALLPDRRRKRRRSVCS